jgi:hypothetical protein
MMLKVPPVAQKHHLLPARQHLLLPPLQQNHPQNTVLLLSDLQKLQLSLPLQHPMEEPTKSWPSCQRT